MVVKNLGKKVAAKKHVVHAPRDYSGIGLPKTFPNWELGAVLEELRPYWGQIPHLIEVEFTTAYRGGADWTVTRADLDLLPDSLWAILKSKIG